MESESSQASSAGRFGYFLLQARATDQQVSGVIENLGTGTKTAFASPDELVRLLEQWGGWRKP